MSGEERDQERRRRRRKRAKRRRREASEDDGGQAPKSKRKAAPTGDDDASEKGDDAPAPAPADPWGLRRQLAMAATAALIGIGIVGTRESFIGALVVVAGVLAMAHAIHRLGRLGPERGR